LKKQWYFFPAPESTLQIGHRELEPEDATLRTGGDESQTQQPC